MTRSGHRATAYGAAAIAYALAHHLGQGAVTAILAALLAIPGATAPDWLEIPWFGIEGRRSLIPHRTLTHWIVPWCLALTWALTTSEPTRASTVFMGFVVGGLTHLVMDVPNPTGIPILLPWRRMSLNLWTGDEMVLPMVLLSWAAGVFALYSVDALTLAHVTGVLMEVAADARAATGI